MAEQVLFLQLFSLYEPPEELYAALSQAAVAAADIHPETQSVNVAIESEQYIPRRMLRQAEEEICQQYGLRTLSITATHPASNCIKWNPRSCGNCLSAVIL